MRRQIIWLATLMLSVPLAAQQAPVYSHWLVQLPKPHNYVLKRVSSYDRTGGEDDFRRVSPRETSTVFDEPGPGVITHIWFTIGDQEMYHLKKIVLRMYWDGESTPSVETPIGDFFGLGLGDYFNYQSAPLDVAPLRAMNSFFPMWFAKHARITVTNEGHDAIDELYFNIDYRVYSKPLPGGTLDFNAQYRHCAPCQAVPFEVCNGKNLTGKGKYVWMTAKGRGQFVGVTMSVLKNADGYCRHVT